MIVCMCVCGWGGGVNFSWIHCQLIQASGLVTLCNFTHPERRVRGPEPPEGGPGSGPLYTAVPVPGRFRWRVFRPTFLWLNVSSCYPGIYFTAVARLLLAFSFCILFVFFVLFFRYFHGLECTPLPGLGRWRGSIGWALRRRCLVFEVAPWKSSDFFVHLNIEHNVRSVEEEVKEQVSKESHQTLWCRMIQFFLSLEWVLLNFLVFWRLLAKTITWMTLHRNFLLGDSPQEFSSGKRFSQNYLMKTHICVLEISWTSLL